MKPDRVENGELQKRIHERFIQDQSGATAIEYALVAGFISISILVVLGSISEKVRTNMFDLVAGMF